MRLDEKRVLVLGATSRIAQEFARRLAERRCRIVLVARQGQRMEAVADDLRCRGAEEIACLTTDLSVSQEHASVLERAWTCFGGVDLALVAYGSYAEGDEAEKTSMLLNLLTTNFVSAAHLSIRVAERFTQQGSGHLAVITSVAGERGRKRNFVYGSAKGGLSILLQGLDHKLARTHVRVSDIRLGIVDTPMTHLLPSPLRVAPERAVAAMVAGLERGQAIIYAPWFWRWIMIAMRGIPRGVMNRLDV
jgi:decaprenylphospho-beta-D-erythro-pentofuranosid-2-ulose 2-reductase